MNRNKYQYPRMECNSQHVKNLFRLWDYLEEAYFWSLRSKFKFVKLLLILLSGGSRRPCPSKRGGACLKRGSWRSTNHIHSFFWGIEGLNQSNFNPLGGYVSSTKRQHLAAVINRLLEIRFCFGSRIERFVFQLISIHVWWCKTR